MQNQILTSHNQEFNWNPIGSRLTSKNKLNLTRLNQTQSRTQLGPI